MTDSQASPTFPLPADASSPRASSTVAIIIQIDSRSAAAPRTINEIRSVMRSLRQPWRLILVRNGKPKPQLASYLDAVCYSEPHYQSVELDAAVPPRLAVAAGLAEAGADACLVISADGSDDPRAIFELVRKWRAGSDCVFAVREQQDRRSRLTSLGKAAYHAAERRTQTRVIYNADDFCILDRRVVEALPPLGDAGETLAARTARLGFRRSLVGMQATWHRPKRLRVRLLNHFRTLRGALLSDSRTPVRFAYTAAASAAGIATASIAGAVAAAVLGADAAWIACGLGVGLLAAICPLAACGVVAIEYLYQLMQHGPAAKRVAVRSEPAPSIADQGRMQSAPAVAAVLDAVPAINITEAEILDELCSLRGEAASTVCWTPQPTAIPAAEASASDA